MIEWAASAMRKVLLTCEDLVCLGPHQRESGSTLLVKKRSGLYPRLAVDGQGRKVVSGAGGVLLTRTAATVGLDVALSAALSPWRRPLTRHDPGKVLLDLAISLAMGGDCLADIGQLRAHPQVFGPVASDPTVSRLIDTLAADARRR
jgi:Transposase DDE domain group 1